MADKEEFAPPAQEEAPAPAQAPAPALPQPFPRVGMGVLYVRDDYSHLDGGLPGGEAVAASVQEVFEDGSVRLQSEGRNISPVGFDAGGAIGTWHYPEKA